MAVIYGLIFIQVCEGESKKLRSQFNFTLADVFSYCDEIDNSINLN